MSSSTLSGIPGPPSHHRRHRRGGILISALVFSVIIAFLLAGIGTFTVSHLSRESTEASYTSALDIAEAGVDYELRKISSNPSNADQYNATTQSGVTYTLGNGTYTVFCENTDGTTPWVAPNDMYLFSTGTLNGVSRTVRVAVKGMYKFHYTLFAQQKATITGPATIGPDIGTNGVVSISNTTVQGTVVFNNDPSLTPQWSGGSPGSTKYQCYANPVVWPTVLNIALQQFPVSSYPPGGLSYIASNNDNNLITPAGVLTNGTQISTNASTTITFYGKPGGANYYLTLWNMNANPNNIVLDNTNGPINIWLGPFESSSSNLWTFNNTTNITQKSTDLANGCRIYVATKTAIKFNGKTTLDAGIYCYNKDLSTGAEFGDFEKTGGASIGGSTQIIAPIIGMTGSTSFNEVSLFQQPDYYGTNNLWMEINGM